jgi:hypothetical protein
MMYYALIIITLAFWQQPSGRTVNDTSSATRRHMQSGFTIVIVSCETEGRRDHNACVAQAVQRKNHLQSANSFFAQSMSQD